ncbi:hypothetical protein A3D00_03905 [Candidatus Woesebacteria bacterium RIFCSPHIGHO2_02_FULL_38_9]|nr:MAG: hypothetical protein A3D00_03905 [Candidatus Woesebacteria bacterium RIFCSPHIGHO2_02_FULL_38_9]
MKTHVRTVRKNTSYKEVVLLLIKHKISGIPVIEKTKKVVGIISEKDLLYQLFPSQEEFYKDIEHYMHHDVIEKEAVKVKKLKAKDFMSRDVISVKPDDHVLTACALLVINNIRRLPVIEKGKLVGIVTSNNLFKNFLRKYVK